MKAHITQIANWMEVPYRDVTVAVAYLPFTVAPKGVRQYDCVDAATSTVEVFQRMIEENEIKLKHTDSECYRSRVAKYTTRRNKAMACLKAWRQENEVQGL